MIQRIEIVRCTTNRFEITITDVNGSLFALQSGEKVLFGVKKSPDDVDYVFLKKITSGSNGVFVVTVNPADTAGIEPGHYCYDVGVQSGPAYYNVIKPSPFDIVANITNWGDGD